MQIAFILPSNSISGGIFTVFKHAIALAARKHDVTIGFMKDIDIHRVKYYPEMEAIRLLSWRELCNSKRFDMVVATWWETLFLLPRIKAEHYIYFVQGFEEEFYRPDSLAASLVLQTYQENVHFITVSEALSKHLKTQFDQSSLVVVPGINLSLFENAEAAIPKSGRLRCMVEGLPNEERKRVAFSLEVLSDFEELEIVYVSPAGRPDYSARMDYFFQSVPYQQMPALYKSCDFLFKFSSTESFALPVLEMFATGGTAIVSAFKGHDEYIYNEKNALVVALDDKMAAENAVKELMSNAELRSQLRSHAQITAKQYSLERSTDLFEQSLNAVIENCRGCRELKHIEKAMTIYENYDQSLLGKKEKIR